MEKMIIEKGMKRKEIPCLTVESKSAVDVCPKSVISYKEYKAQKEVKQRASAADKSTPGEEEDWDAESSLPPQETPPGASSMAPSQEDDWIQMINQDLHSGSITDNSGHGTMTATRETESMEDVKELTGVDGGVNESASAEYLADVKWRDDDQLFVFDNDNVTKPQTPTTASTPVQACEEEDPVASSLESPLRKKPHFQESIADQLSKTTPGRLEPNYDKKELVGFTRPSLVDVIPWIRYEAQNMVEPIFREELQCIRDGASSIHYSDDCVVQVLETRSRMVAIDSSM